MTESNSPEDYRLWVGRSDAPLHKIAIQLGESISLDKELYKEDIQASIAHARMLAKMNILAPEEIKKIEKAFQQIEKEIKSGCFTYDIALEDIHTHIEKRLIEICGEAGRRLHTARSRNDQIAVDTHLFVQSRSQLLAQEMIALCKEILKKAETSVEILMPGYTHLQIAQPIRLSHHLLAYFWTFLRDIKHLAEASHTAGVLPLGSGAFAGVNYENDRSFLKKELGFRSIYPNSMDAVSSRDHLLDFVYAAAVFMTHASRLCEEIVLWHSHEFAFLQLPDHLTTGSSMMPQKKNPDLAELIRGKTGRVQANLHNLLTNLKSLPMSYNRDLQEDRFPLLDSYHQTLLCIQGLTVMISEACFSPKNMLTALQKGFAVATDLADALVKEKKLSFREAHHYVGKLVSYCIEHQLTLEQVDRGARASISSHIEDDLFYQKAIDLETSVEKKKSYGSTSLESQKVQIKEAKTALAKWENYKWKE